MTPYALNLYVHKTQKAITYLHLHYGKIPPTATSSTSNSCVERFVCNAKGSYRLPVY